MSVPAMTKILLAVDGSASSIRATRKVVEAARLYRESVSVELVTVHLPISSVGGLFDTVVSKQTVDRCYKDEGAQALAASERILSEAFIAYTSRILSAISPRRSSSTAMRRDVA